MVPIEYECGFNEGCSCRWGRKCYEYLDHIRPELPEECGRCGWNPAVMARRMEESKRGKD